MRGQLANGGKDLIAHVAPTQDIGIVYPDIQSCSDWISDMYGYIIWSWHMGLEGYIYI